MFCNTQWLIAKGTQGLLRQPAPHTQRPTAAKQGAASEADIAATPPVLRRLKAPSRTSSSANTAPSPPWLLSAARQPHSPTPIVELSGSAASCTQASQPPRLRCARGCSLVSPHSLAASFARADSLRLPGKGSRHGATTMHPSTGCPDEMCAISCLPHWYRTAMCGIADQGLQQRGPAKGNRSGGEGGSSHGIQVHTHSWQGRG